MEDKIKDIEIENFVVLIYFILLLIYLYSNKIRVDYLFNNYYRDKEIYQVLILIVFGISLVISLYYFVNNLNKLNNYNGCIEIYNLNILSVVAGILIIIATIIYLYIKYNDINY